MTYQNDMNFNTNTQPNLAAAAPGIDTKVLMQLAQLGQPQPATKQPASIGMQATQPAAQVNTTAAQNLGAAIGKWMQQYNTKMQQYGGGQGQQQPTIWSFPAQQQVGPPMNIVPQGYGYQ